MSPLQTSDNAPEKIISKSSRRIWYCFKIVKYILVLLCIMLLPIHQHFSTVEDDFTIVYRQKNYTKEKNTLSERERIITDRNPDLGHLYSENGEIYRIHRSINKTLSDHEHATPTTRLTELLIMYPCCTSIIIIIGMEMVGQALGDPLTKFTNIILVFLCIILSLVVFIVSILAAVRTIQTTMIIISILSVLFFLCEVVDFLFLLIS